MFAKTTDNPQILVMFLGYPGSGKSYFAIQLAEQIGAVRFNGDAMRVALYGSIENTPKEAHGPGSIVFKGIDYFAEQVLAAGKSVIYDSHHNRRPAREMLESMAKKYNAMPVVVWIKTPPEIAKERAINREETEDQDKLSEEKYAKVLKRQMAHFNPPLETEKVIEIDGTEPFEEQFLVFKSYFDKNLPEKNFVKK